MGTMDIYISINRRTPRWRRWRPNFIYSHVMLCFRHLATKLVYSGLCKLDGNAANLCCFFEILLCKLSKYSIYIKTETRLIACT